MRLIVAFILVAFFCPLGDTPVRAAAPEGAEKYWVFFVDKQMQSGKSTQPIVIDQRTLARRARRGQVMGAWEDLPVSADYVAAVRNIAPSVLVESRWLNAVSVRADADQRRQLSALPFVVRVARVGERPASREAPSGPLPLVQARKTEALDYGPSRQQLAFVNAIRPLEEEVNGAGVRIGFLDTRFDFSHPALRHIEESGRLLAVRDFTIPNQEAYGGTQTNFHGLNVTSIALGYDPGNLIGPAYGAEVLAGTTEFAPTETNQEEDNFVAGIEWLESEGVDVVNVSLGYTTFDEGEHSYTPEDLDGDTGITTIAADRASMLGVVMVVSAGNSGTSPWRTIGTPADGDSVIAVGAATPDSIRASFSSIGPTADGRTKPDVAALGTSVVVAVPSGGYVTGSGTSFSSPMVAGVVAQMLQVNPSLSPVEVLEILRSTAHQTSMPNNQLGWGIVDAFAAVEEARILAANLPTEVVMRTAYPNPFSDVVNFELIGPIETASARVTLYDILGRDMGVVFDGPLEPGTNVVAYRPQNLSSGVYFYRLETGSSVSTGTVVHIR